LPYKTKFKSQIFILGAHIETVSFSSVIESKRIPMPKRFGWSVHVLKCKAVDGFAQTFYI